MSRNLLGRITTREALTDQNRGMAQKTRPFWSRSHPGLNLPEASGPAK